MVSHKPFSSFLYLTCWSFEAFVCIITSWNERSWSRFVYTTYVCHRWAMSTCRLVLAISLNLLEGFMLLTFVEYQYLEEKGWIYRIKQFITGRRIELVQSLQFKSNVKDSEHYTKPTTNRFSHQMGEFVVIRWFE